MVSFTKFDASEFLDNDEVIAHYLAAALEDENPDLFTTALGDVAKAHGMSLTAAATELGHRQE
jgi:probable addiction module antidote protein